MILFSKQNVHPWIHDLTYIRGKETTQLGFTMKSENCIQLRLDTNFMVTKLDRIHEKESTCPDTLSSLLIFSPQLQHITE